MTKEKRKVGLQEGFNYFGTLGNENHVKNHIAYFEKKLKKEIEPYMRTNLSARAQCHNFAAWIRLYTELICNKLAWSLHRAIGGWEYINKLNFVQLKKEVEKEATQGKIQSNKYKFQNIIKALEYVLELRSSYQHGGMPNPMREKRCKVDEMVLRKMSNPRHYKRTKVIFSCAYELFEFLPKPQVVFYADGYLENKTKILEDKMNEEKIEILLFFSNKYFFKSTFPIDSYDEAIKIAKEIILNCNQNLNYIKIQENGEEIGTIEKQIFTRDLRKPE